MSGFPSPEQIGKVAVRKKFITSEQFKQALIVSRKKPEVSFLDHLQVLGFLGPFQAQVLKEYDYSSETTDPTFSLRPGGVDSSIIPPVSTDSLVLRPIDEDELEKAMFSQGEQNPSTKSLKLEGVSPSSFPMLRPEPDSKTASQDKFEHFKQENGIYLLPEPETLPSFDDLKKALEENDVPEKKELEFSHPEDELFAQKTISDNFLNRDTVEVLIEMQKSLEKMALQFPIAQLAKELEYLDEQLIFGLQNQLKLTETLVQNYSLGEKENKAVNNKLNEFFSEVSIREAGKLQEYLKMLGIEKTLPETLLIQGRYKRGEYQRKAASSISRISRRSPALSQRLASAKRAPSRKRRS